MVLKYPITKVNADLEEKVNMNVKVWGQTILRHPRTLPVGKMTK